MLREITLAAVFVNEWDGHTTLHPLGITAVLALGLTMMFLRRRYAVIPMLLMACFIAPAQRVVIATLDFDLLRIMVVFGCMRVVVLGEWRAIKWRVLDTAIVLWTVMGMVTMLLLTGNPSMVVGKLGYSFDAIGFYFLFRALIRDWDDVFTAGLALAAISVPIAAAFVLEFSTARNMFSIFGGVPEITDIRDGQLRCQGAFAHPILAGCFWAAALPLIAAQWWRGGMARWGGIIGVGTASVIIVLCCSSTPILGAALGLAGGAFFLVRRYMRAVRWSLLALAIALHLSMIAPVWHLISRLHVIGGSTGYHRFALIDAAIHYFDEWWLIGTARGTEHWGYGLVDVTNHYLVQGLQGGIGLLILFIAIIALAYREVGYIWRAAAGCRRNEILGWSLGVCLFIHTTSFLAITYFGQINLIWYLNLAMIGSLGALGRAPAKAKEPAAARTGRRVVARRPLSSMLAADAFVSIGNVVK